MPSSSVITKFFLSIFLAFFAFSFVVSCFSVVVPVPVQVVFWLPPGGGFAPARAVAAARRQAPGHLPEVQHELGGPRDSLDRQRGVEERRRAVQRRAAPVHARADLVFTAASP